MRIVYEKIVPSAGNSFALLDKKARAFDGRFHFHPEIEITLIQASRGRRVVGDSIESFAPGDLVLLGENLPHQYVSDAPPTRGHPARAKVIQFRADFLCGALNKAPEFERIWKMISGATRGLKFSAASAEAATAVIDQLFASSGTLRLVRLLELLDLLGLDGRAAPIASAGYFSRINTREGDAIDRALEYLNTNFTQSVTLDDLSGHLHVSSATCNRLLHKSIGRSFKASLNEIRISHACRLLLETEQPIVDVAYSSGFNNLSNFNRRFKELKRRTPKAYRNLARQHA
jgi:AraC-like DNA-binding protein